MPYLRIVRWWALLAAAIIAAALGAITTPVVSGHQVSRAGIAGDATAAAKIPTRQKTGTVRLADAAVPHVTQHPFRAACAQPVRPGVMACLALVRTDVKGHEGLFRRGVTAQTAPSGYGPADLQSAYSLPSSTAGSGATVAVVDAYNDPNAAADLATYRAQYGLPACTEASGCFQVVNQNGQPGPLPADAGTSGWDAEESVDVDMVSAACPNCRIILVEADDPDTTGPNLETGVDAAVTLGAEYVSNSYGGNEDPSQLQDDQYYDHPGTVITASAGDSGYGVNYPSGSQYVTAVGGTTLVQDQSTSRGWVESVWGNGTEGTRGDGTGSGCSGFEPQPSWQVGVTQDCTNRATADISAVADPNTGVAVYDSYTGGGWQEFGGTSVASPLIASAYALAGPPSSATYPASYPYAHDHQNPSVFNDVTSGSNGDCGNALCNAGPGWDGPTGLGTPNGVAGLAYVRTGSIAGTVTDAATGQPVAGAIVSMPGISVTTGGDGSYTLSTLPGGSYLITVSAYAYRTQTQTVSVTATQTTTQNFQLTELPRAIVSGTVTQGSGTAWPLYAQVSWTDGNGHSGTTYTIPATGQYSLSLLENGSYSLTATPLYPGYITPTAKTVNVGTGNVTQDFSAAVDLTACTALGYYPVYSGGTQAFNSTSAPPGWTVANVNLGYPGYTEKPGWVFNDPGKRGNNTGGAGGFAIVDSAYDGAHHYQDTELTSPAVNFSADHTPVAQFATDLAGATNSTAAVDVSTDGGKNWVAVWRDVGMPGDPGPSTVAVPLPQAAGKAKVKVRFIYTGEWSQYWEIDNVFLGDRTCTQQTGGLLIGRVTDTAGTAINGATVASVTNPAERATTVATPGNSAINGGLYWLFTSAAGSQQFKASDTGYATTAQSITVTVGQVSTLNFTLLG